jgi:hypothetical protein
MAQHLLQSAFGCLKFPFERLLRFLDKDVEHDNTSLHNGAVEYSGDPFLPSDASLEEPFPHGARMRHTKIGAELAH